MWAWFFKVRAFRSAVVYLDAGPPICHLPSATMLPCATTLPCDHATTLPHSGVEEKTSESVDCRPAAQHSCEPAVRRRAGEGGRGFGNGSVQGLTVAVVHTFVMHYFYEGTLAAIGRSTRHFMYYSWRERVLYSIATADNSTYIHRSTIYSTVACRSTSSTSDFFVAPS